MKAKPTDISTLLKSNAASNGEQVIKDFFKKPIRLTNGAFATTDSGNTVICPGIVTFMASQTQFDLWRLKFKGYYAARFTMVFRLVVNATRFQQGRYILAFVPSGGTGGNQNMTEWYSAHATTLRQVVQLPHAEIDLATDTECVLKIPFVMNQVALPVKCFNNIESMIDLGYLISRPYSPLVAASGSSVADYTIYMSLEDVELFGAATQSGIKQRNGTSRKRNVQEQEQDQMGIGPFETGFRGLSMVSDAVSNVPLLGQFAGRAKWATDFLAGVCSKFGWCKPVNLSPVGKYRRVIFPNISNADGSDLSAVLSLSEQNIVDICPGYSGTDIDEMSYGFLTSIPNYCGSFNLSTSDTSGGVLTTVNLCPQWANLKQTITDHSESMDCMGTLYYLSKLHQYYRGNLTLKLKFVKTEFHSGRIMVAFFPSILTNSVSTTFDDTAYVNRVIVDLRETNEIEFEVPFVSTLPYRLCDDPYGFIKIFVVDPLIAPNTVSSSVTVLMEMRGSQSLEYAIPITTGLVPAQPTATQSGVKESNSNAQSAGLHLLGSSTFDEICSAESCIGERVVSLRTLIKRPIIWSSYSVSGSSSTTLMTFSVIPNQLSKINYYSPGVWIAPDTLMDLIDVVAPLYALSRGSLRIKLVDTTASAGLLAATLLPVPSTQTITPGYSTTLPTKQSAQTTLALTAGLGQNALTTITRPDLTGGIEVQIPHYNNSHSCINAKLSNPAGSYYGVQGYGAPSKLLNFEFSIDGAGYILRSGGDDYSLGCFVSVPPFVG